MPKQTPEQLGMVAKAIKLTAKSLGVKIDDDILDLWLCELATDSHVAVMNAIRSCLRECRHGRLAWQISLSALQDARPVLMLPGIWRSRHVFGMTVRRL